MMMHLKARQRLVMLLCFFGAALPSFASPADMKPAEGSVSFGKGQLTLTTLAPNAIRIRYTETAPSDTLPDWIYTGAAQPTDNTVFNVRVDAKKRLLQITDRSGRIVFEATNHQLRPSTVSGEPTQEARLAFRSPDDECLYGLGQFQDGVLNVRGLTRRLTQVNTQIAIPMLISSKGYGVLWNNYGLTDFNPCSKSVALTRGEGTNRREAVNVTSTEGGKQEIREENKFTATLKVSEEGDYSLMLDVGQKMARRHHLTIDGEKVIDMQNVWLPPTTSTIVHLTKGTHVLEAHLTRDDKPVLYYNKVQPLTVLQSPVADAVDYTVFLGTADEIIATYRKLTGEAPLMPQWALGYIHCRERFHSQDEILKTAQHFRQEELPVDVIVQDWQYWGKYGWNAMKFDEDHYPTPSLMTDSLHRMNMRLMVSVWSKIDRKSEVGRQMAADGHYIPGTDWIDFFNPASADAYWKNFSQRLLPVGIDAWWQDATEPENDDLVGRRVWNGRYAGERFRNVYPLLVNKTVFEGLMNDRPNQRPMILTRCGYTGIQRYGSAMWSGDVGNDWKTLRQQIIAGLGMQAAGIPWWTYDAGGFFRPANQYKDTAYVKRMLRWIQTAVYLPLMRVHGYMSNTEPWEYGPKAQAAIARCLNERYSLMPYIYSQAAAVSFEGSTLMRPLVFDFPDDPEALRQECEYMFGPSLLISPVTEPDATQWTTYLPQHDAGWYDYHTGRHYDGGQYVTTTIDDTFIPVFVKAGSILPLCHGKDYATDRDGVTLEMRVYPGKDAKFTLYEDDGYTNDYRNGKYRRTTYRWNEASQKLEIDN